MGGDEPVSVLWVEAGGEPAPADALDAEDGLDVTVESDFVAATERAAGEGVDCVVSDHSEGGTDGVALLEAVRTERSGLPFFLVPTDGGEAVASRAIDAGVTGYVPRENGAVEELADRIREAVAETASDEVRAPIKDRSLREELRLKELAMDQAPVGITIADAAEPDNPLVYVNDAFEEMTGYLREEALGANCRFLQGEGTDPDAVERLREGIEAEEPVTVELRNYRKDGTEFWNRLSVYPTTDDDGEVSYYAGFQSDITELVRVRRQLDEERRRLRRVLDRIDDLVGDIADILGRVDSEADILQRATSRLGTGDEYEFAWLGELDRAAGTLTVTEWTGDGEDIGGRTVDLDGDGAGPRTVRAALDTGEVQTLTGFEPWGCHPDDAGACAVVPILHRDTAYGVLTVYDGDEEAFDEHEVSILRVLGRTIGGAINAHRTRRMALTDTGIEVAVDVGGAGEFPAGLAAGLGVTMELESLREHRGGSLELLFTVDGADRAAIEDAADRTDGVEEVELLADGEESVVRFVVADSDLVDALWDRGARLTHLRTTGDGRIRLGFETDDQAAAQATIGALEEAYPSVDLVAYHESEQIGQTTQGFRALVEEQLTDRQLETLRKAYVAGFFEWPRSADGDELAESMGVVPSTFHQHLRAAQRKLVGTFFDQ